MSFSYGNLRERILEKYGTLAKFADLLGMSRTTLSLKLNNFSSFTSDEISKACELLDIEALDIPKYFFCLKSSEN